MDLALSDEQAELVVSFGNLLTRASSPDKVRAAEPDGFDRALWDTLLQTGAVTMAVPTEQGGWGASLLDLSLVAEQLGLALAPAPVIEVQVASRLLAGVACDAACGALGGVLQGVRMVTLALHPPRNAVAALTPAGAVCDDVVVLDGERLLLVAVPAGARRPVANLGSAPLADLDVAHGVELEAGAAAVERFEAAIDEWLTLTASALVGVATRAHEQVCAYAAERRAFGSVIGTYQGVAHPLADDATRLDGARLLARKAAWSLDVGDPRSRELAAMAFAFASETAERATYDAVHFHGGYGFMLEHDVQLHYRRARGWARVWGDADAGYCRAAAARYGAVPPGDG
ncbi:MAG TPA: acyl-CoA dehydrogenase [Acidimicrobiales bacterium]|nr:acyl-CoA dehydrogenase [Acidimicrobiales bacterium]